MLPRKPSARRRIQFKIHKARPWKVGLKHAEDVRGLHIVVAGKPLDRKAQGDAPLEKRGYTFRYVKFAHVVGTHGTTEFSVRPIKDQHWEGKTVLHLLMDKRAPDRETAEKLTALKEENAHVAYLHGAEVPPEHQTLRGQPQDEKLSIGKRMSRRVIQHVRRAGAKFIYTTTEFAPAKRGSEASGFKVLREMDLGGGRTAWILGIFLDEKLEKKVKKKK